MTETEGTENTELNAQSESSESDAELDTQPEGDDETTGINIEDAERRASADYQERIKEFDSVDSTPVVSVPATGESGPVEMPKP
ncbi:MAG: hypothetical protein JO296_00945 [Pseudonocardiales bacterium]|jgi:hypothetical protein|nr:hypothetical protein [Pseudonocardiales bacterium]MBV9648692.1 hypothetical protein [Pseudonocardiales bacterium]